MGGKLGIEIAEKLGIQKVGDLYRYIDETYNQNISSLNDIKGRFFGAYIVL